MHLGIHRPVPLHAKFDVPHKPVPMRFRDIVAEFPDFVALFDGEAEENTLLFYYKFNKDRCTYEFKDTESEEEVAELMKVPIVEFQEDETEENQHENRKLTKEELDVFREHIQDIRKGREWLETQDQWITTVEESVSSCFGNLKRPWLAFDLCNQHRVDFASSRATSLL